MCMAFVFFIIHDCDSSILTPLYNPGIFEVVERGIKWFKVPHIHPAYIPRSIRAQQHCNKHQCLIKMSDTMIPHIIAQERCHKLLQIFAGYSFVAIKRLQSIFLPLTLANVHTANRTADHHVTSEHPSTIKYSTASYNQSAQQHQHSAASSNSHKLHIEIMTETEAS
ncbi:Ribosomal protein uS12 methylthiotransferase RimO [Trichinella spiralis]|uniref:Ribosomal protein uS12 methylthiotransferase RimO n=1 Tax=Trichinella spiralis TaxID=6334 RepID=A0ABR3K9D9_TRISP